MISAKSLAQIKRWWEVAAVLALAALGAYWAYLGGFVLMPLGLGVMALCIPMCLSAYRRQRFAQSIGAAGVIEVVEGELRFFAPAEQGGNPAGMGGFINLPDLVELRLVHLDHHRFWRLKSQDGQALLIPVDAAGNDALFDVFAALPQMDSAALVAALTASSATGTATQTLWRRPALHPALREGT
jgi:hypothetical protein